MKKTSNQHTRCNKYTSSNQHTRCFGFVMLAIALGLIFMFTAFPTFTGEHTKSEIQQITGMSEHSAYIINALIRKSAHILMYGCLGILFYRVIRKRPIWYAWVLTTIIASLDEWHQSLVPGRSPLLQDVVIDSIAAFLFIVVVFLLRRK